MKIKREYSALSALFRLSAELKELDAKKAEVSSTIEKKFEPLYLKLYKKYGGGLQLSFHKKIPKLFIKVRNAGEELKRVSDECEISGLFEHSKHVSLYVSKEIASDEGALGRLICELYDEIENEFGVLNEIYALSDVMEKEKDDLLELEGLSNEISAEINFATKTKNKYAVRIGSSTELPCIENKDYIAVLTAQNRIEFAIKSDGAGSLEGLSEFKKAIKLIRSTLLCDEARFAW